MRQEHRKLQDLATIQSGHQFRGAIKPVEGGDTYVVQMSAVEPDVPVPWSALAAVDLPKGSRPRLLEDGDVLFAARGHTNFAVLCEGIPKGQRVVTSPHFFIIRLQDNNLDPAFLTWQLNLNPIQSHLSVIAAGGTQRAVPIRELKTIKVTVPPLDRQRQILDLHEEVLREKTLLNSLIENRDQLMASIATDLHQQTSNQERI